jgi:hypothetical protein
MAATFRVRGVVASVFGLSREAMGKVGRFDDESR